MNFRYVGQILMLLAFAHFAWATPQVTTYQARIVKPDGYPLEASNVNFKFTILNPAGNCILYSETYSSVSMVGTGGLMSFPLGSGIRVYPSSGTTFAEVFDNSIASLTCDAGGPGNYNPGSSDIRKIVMQFNDGNGWQTLPAMNINAVPYAIYANDAMKLGGVSATAFVQYSTLPTCTASESLSYNGASFACVAAGTPQATVTSSTVITALGYTPADGVSVTALTSSLNSTNANVSAVSSTLSNVSSFAAAVSSAVYSVSSTVSSLENSVSSLQSSVAASFASLVSSPWNTSGTTINYIDGNVGIGTASPTARLTVAGQARIIGAVADIDLGGACPSNATIYRGNNSTKYKCTCASSGGSVWGTDIYTDDSSLCQAAIHAGVYTVGTTAEIIFQPHPSTGPYTGSTQNGVTTSSYGGFPGSYIFHSMGGLTVEGRVGIGISTPVTQLDVSGGVRLGMEDATCAVGYAGTLRYNAGHVEFCNGTTWTAFTSSAASIAQALGYTPANSATVTTLQNNLSAVSATAGNALVKINNLSDLSNVTTARSNLGLGAFATASSLDLGSASATGIIADARLANQSGVSSGTQYTKVTVDGKGRVTSGTQLSASDVTTALGYTPQASGVISSQWTTSGTTINYMAGNIGIGTTNPGSKLVVKGAGVTSATSALNVTDSSNNSAFYVRNDGNVGVGTISPITSLDVAGGVRISMESATCAVSYAGTLRYNSGNVEFCNGTTWAAFGISTSGLTSFNGSTSQTQTFANGTAGNAPAFVSANGVHTLNIPLASATGSVTAGLISNADYISFSNKITSSAASIAQVLGYVPASATALGSYLVKANNLSDLTSSATARINLGLGAFATMNSLDLGSASATGTLAAARLPAFAGDVSSTAGNNSLTVTALRGISVSTTAPVSGQILTYNGTAWTPMVAGNSSQWNTSGTTINYLAGNVGIGTSAPTSRLDVMGNTKVSYQTVNLGACPSSGSGYTDSAIVYRCTCSGTYTLGSIWGSGPYTSDSALCRAAVHAGLFTNGSTQDIFFQPQPGQSSYTGTTQNGITTSSYGTYGSSYILRNNTAAFAVVDGKIGIGTDTPVKELDVTGSAIISGSVGIGTSSPATALDVNGAATFRQAYFEKVGALGTLACGATPITGYSTNLYTLTACSSGSTILNIPVVTGWPSGSMSWTVTFFVTAQTGSTFNVRYNNATTNVFWDKNSTGGAGGANYAGFLINDGATNVFTCTVLNTGSVAVYCGVSAQY